MRLPVSKQDLRDAKDLDRFIEAYNADKTRSEGAVTNKMLGAFADMYGGAKHPQLWSGYRSGKRRIPARDKVIAAFYLNTRPEHIFRSWPKFKRWKLLIDALGDNASADELLLFSEMVALFANVTDEQRALAIEKLRTFK